MSKKLDCSSAMPNANDIVASWEVPLSDGVHLVEFEHGTTTGKRVIRVDGKVSIHCTTNF